MSMFVCFLLVVLVFLLIMFMVMVVMIIIVIAFLFITILWLSKTMYTIKLFLRFNFECCNFFFIWFWIDVNFVLKLFNSLINLTYICWRKNVQVTESGQGIDIMINRSVLIRFFLFFFFFDFFGSFLIKFIFLSHNYFTSFFHLFFPIFIF